VRRRKQTERRHTLGNRSETTHQNFPHLKPSTYHPPSKQPHSRLP
jgi:hypothetical protein